MKSISTSLLTVFFCLATSFSAISQTNHVVISQLFGSGGTAASLPNNDFIELYNPTNTVVNLNGWTVQFAFGHSATYTKIALTGSILSKGYYLIQLGRDNYATGTAMPTPDVVFNFNINEPDMKAALVNRTNSITGSNPSSSSSVVDFVGTGTATGFEGQPAPQGSYNVSLLRKSSTNSTTNTLAANGSEANSGNGLDTDNNRNDMLLTTAVRARSSNMTVLAVQLHSFMLTQSGSANHLRWQMATTEAAAFAVEKSKDGVSFAHLTQVNGTSTTYQFADANTTTAAYYRLRITSKDGSTQYSPVVYAEGKTNGSMLVYPTIATDVVTLQLPAMTKGGSVLVYNMSGTLQQSIATTQAQIKLSVATLKPGTYVVQYTTAAGQKMMERFVKA